MRLAGDGQPCPAAATPRPSDSTDGRVGTYAGETPLGQLLCCRHRQVRRSVSAGLGGPGRLGPKSEVASLWSEQ